VSDLPIRKKSWRPTNRPSRRAGGRAGDRAAGWSLWLTKPAGLSPPVRLAAGWPACPSRKKSWQVAGRRKKKLGIGWSTSPVRKKVGEWVGDLGLRVRRPVRSRCALYTNTHVSDFAIGMSKLPVCKFSYRAGQVVDLPRPSWRRAPGKKNWQPGVQPPPPEKKSWRPDARPVERAGRRATRQQPTVILVGKAMGLPPLVRPVGQPTWPAAKKKLAAGDRPPPPEKKVGRVGAGKKIGDREVDLPVPKKKVGRVAGRWTGSTRSRKEDIDYTQPRVCESISA